MFGFGERWSERRDMIEMAKDLEEQQKHKAELASYASYQDGQAAGLREGEAIGYEKGLADGIAKGFSLCAQILERRSEAPESLAEELGVSVSDVQKILQGLEAR